MRAPLAIAETADQLTPAWLTAALDQPVAAADCRPLGTGQMCDSVRVTYRLDGDRDDAAARTLVAKLPAADPVSRNTALAMRSYEKEVRFYQLLAADLPVHTPDVRYADLDVDTASFVLLLDDLAPAEQGDQLAGCSPATAEVAVDELVRLHAPRWGDESLLDLPWLRNDDPDGRAMMAMLMPMLWDGFRDRYGDAVEPHVRQAGDVLFPAIGAFMLLPDAGPRTLTHGDFRLDNLLFAPADAPGPAPVDVPAVTVVDWQTCSFGPAMHDVAYFIGAGLSAVERREHEERLVVAYHRGLVGAGVNGYGWDACWADYRRGTWAGLLMAVGAAMMVERTDRGDRMFLTMASRHARHALDLDADDTLR